MPGLGGHRFQWKERPPLYSSVLAIMLAGYAAALIFASNLLPYVTAASPAPNRYHAVTVDGRVRYGNFFVWWLWDEGESVCVLLAVALIVIIILKRHQIERVQ